MQQKEGCACCPEEMPLRVETGHDKYGHKVFNYDDRIHSSPLVRATLMDELGGGVVLDLSGLL